MKKLLLALTLLALAVPCHAAQVWSWNNTNMFKSPGFNPTMAATNSFTPSDSGTLGVGSGSVWTYDPNYAGLEDADHVFVTNFLGAMTRTISRGTNLWALTGGTLAPSVAQTTLRATNIQSHDNLTAMGGFTFNLGTNIVMPPGSNTVPVANAISRYSYVWLTSDANTTDPTLRTAYLGVPTVRGGFLLVENYTNGVIAQSAFQMTNQAPLVGAMLPWQTLTLINGDWKPTRGGESLLLQTDGRGWREVARFWGADGTVQTNLHAIINPRQFYVPYKADTNRFGDSDWYFTATGMGIDTNIYFGPGNTNVWFRDTDDTLTYRTSDPLGYSKIGLTNTASHLYGRFELRPGGAIAVQGFGTEAILASQLAAIYVETGLSPYCLWPSSDLDLGRPAAAPWGSLWLDKTNFVSKYSDSTGTNYVRLAQTVTGSTAIIDLQSVTNAVNGPVTGYSFRTNGVEVFSVTGTGGPSSGANWAASGATDSTLAGTATSGGGFSITNAANTKSVSFKQGDWYPTAGVSYIRSEVANTDGVLDVLANGNGTAWIDIGDDYTVLPAGSEFLMLMKKDASYGTISVKALGTGTARDLIVQDQTSYSSTGKIGFYTNAPTSRMHARFDTNAPSAFVMENDDGGTSAYASIEARNESGTSGQCRIMALGTNYTTVGGLMQDAGALEANVNLTNGLGILARATTGTIRLYTGGVADANERMRIAATGPIGIGTNAPDQVLHIRKDQAAVTTLAVENDSSSTAAYTSIEARNESGLSGNCRIGVLGTGWTSNGAFVQDSGLLEAGPNLSGGLSILTRQASAPIRFYTGGFADANERVRILSTGELQLYGALIGGRTNVLVSTTAKDFFYVSVPNTNGIGGHVVYTVFCTDGTDVQEISGDVKFAAVAKGTTVTATLADVQGPAALTGGSTLTAALAANVTTNNVFALGVTATTSLTTTNLVIKWRVETPSTFTVNAIP